MTNEQKNYLIDLLYVLEAKEKFLQYSDKLVAKLYMTQEDIEDLKTIIQEVIKLWSTAT